VLDALGVRTAHVAGLSIGGLVAQAMAHAAPERVRSLLLCATAMVLPPPARWLDRAVLARRLGIAAIADDVLSRWTTPASSATVEARGLRAILARTAPEGYAGAAEAIAAADLTSATHALRVPALVVVGDRDLSTPPDCAVALRDAILGSELIVIEDAAHIVTVEKAEAVTAAMRRFLLARHGDAYEVGLAVRKEVLGETHVARAAQATTELDRDFQRFLTETVWGDLWAREHFDRRTRSIVTLALLAALGRHEELAIHVRAMRNTGATAADLSELLLHVAVYAGIPAANAAMRVAKATLLELGEP
jgi:3-oxoadipate enol-lactonase/4-carboxymuconolactone decarboxylase